MLQNWTVSGRQFKSFGSRQVLARQATLLSSTSYTKYPKAVCSTGLTCLCVCKFSLCSCSSVNLTYWWCAPRKANMIATRRPACFWPVLSRFITFWSFFYTGDIRQFGRGSTAGNLRIIIMAAQGGWTGLVLENVHKCQCHSGFSCVNINRQKCCVSD